LYLSVIVTGILLKTVFLGTTAFGAS